jgi:large subunit ribosomal protein L15
MDLSTLQYLPGARRSRKRIGRGPSSGHGKTAGRGAKGQKARSGYSRRRGFEGGQMPLYRRLPKRGFHHRNRFPYAVVNVDALDKAFEAGALVTPEAIVAAGLAGAQGGGVKVLGRGEITRKLTVRVNEVSPTARAKIEAAGGVVEILGIPATAAPKESREDK